MKKTYYSPKIASLATATNILPFVGSLTNYIAAQTLSIEDYSIWNSVSSSTTVASLLPATIVTLAYFSPHQKTFASNPILGLTPLAGYTFNYFMNNYAELNYEINTAQHEINTVKPLGDITTFETDI